jgi:general nucleoside transport system permease protein
MATARSARFRGLTPAQATELAERTRYQVTGGLIILLGVAGYWFFARDVDPSLLSTFGMNTGSAAGTIQLPDLVVPSYATVVAISALSVMAGAWQLWRSVGRWTTALLGTAILLFVASFLIWATRDQSINLASMFRTTLQLATPLAIGALAGVLSERAGVVNIAIEGLMLSAALVAVIVASLAHNIWLGLAAAVLTGAVLSLSHGILSIRYKVDQIISGMVINIFASGITSFISAKFLENFTQLNQPGTFPNWAVPLLSSIPFIGGIVFDNNLFIYAMLAMVAGVQIALFNTRWGLRTRIVGEHPKAADTLGIDVFRMRYQAVILSGLFAGFAGAYFTLGSVGRFDRLMTSGRGFISLAAMIFGNWTPFGSVGASLIFGFADSLQGKLAILNVPIASSFLLMAPYIATMIALAGLVRRATPPAADGQPYVKQ